MWAQDTRVSSVGRQHVGSTQKLHYSKSNIRATPGARGSILGREGTFELWNSWFPAFPCPIRHHTIEAKSWTSKGISCTLASYPHHNRGVAVRFVLVWYLPASLLLWWKVNFVHSNEVSYWYLHLCSYFLSSNLSGKISRRSSQGPIYLNILRDVGLMLPISLIGLLKLSWRCMARLLVMNAHQKIHVLQRDCTMWPKSRHHSRFNGQQNWACMIIQRDWESSIGDSYNICVSVLILILEMKTLIIHNSYLDETIPETIHWPKI